MIRRWLLLGLMAWAIPVCAQQTPALVQAVKSGDASATSLITGGADVNAASSDGTTALMWAIHRDDVATIEQLLKAGASAKARNAYGASPMSEAAVLGDVAVIRKLLAAGADANAPGADGQTPLMVVSRTSNTETADLLIKHGAKVNARETLRQQTALMWAAAQSQARMVQLLIHRGADVNAREFVNQWSRQITSEPRVQVRPAGGLTPLLYAARQGCSECVRFLLEGHADPNLADPDGITPLIMAVENLHVDLASNLLKQGADPNRWDWWGRTALYAAVDVNTLPYGGRPDHVPLDQVTSLQLIAQLLNAGANPNPQLKLFPPYRDLGADRGADLALTIGATPLFRAAKAGDAPAIRLLLAHGANIELPNNAGITPLMAAAGAGSNDQDTRGRFRTSEQAAAAVDLLLAAGADINARDGLGRTALHGAAFWGWNDVVKKLVAQGAIIGAKDAKGMTPVDSAMGRAGGHGRGQTPVIHQETASLLQRLAATASLDTAKTDPHAH